MTAILPVEMLLGYLAFAQPVQAQLNPPTTTQTAAPEYKNVDSSIEKYLCTPNDSNLGGALFNCISKVYRFGVAFGAIAVVFFIVLAGYMYITGGEAAKGKAKTMIQNSIIGIALMLGSYLLLSFINPDLVKIKPIQAPIFSASDLPKCADVGLGVNCVLPDGQVNVPNPAPGGASGCANRESGSCTKQVISACPAFASQMENSLRACNQESMGGRADIASTVDRCDETTTGKVVAFSWGLWQLNVAAGSYGAEFPECKGVLSQAGGPWSTLCITGGTCGRKCTFGKGADAFYACTKALADPVRNTKQACNLYAKSGWGPWPYTKKVCNLP